MVILLTIQKTVLGPIMDYVLCWAHPAYQWRYAFKQKDGKIYIHQISRPIFFKFWS